MVITGWTYIVRLCCAFLQVVILLSNVFKDGVVMRSSGKHTQRGYRSSCVQHDKLYILCYGGFLQSKVIASGSASKLVYH